VRVLTLLFEHGTSLVTDMHLVKTLPTTFSAREHTVYVFRKLLQSIWKVYAAYLCVMSFSLLWFRCGDDLVRLYESAEVQEYLYRIDSKQNKHMHKPGTLRKASFACMLAFLGGITIYKTINLYILTSCT